MSLILACRARLPDPALTLTLIVCPPTPAPPSMPLPGAMTKSNVESLRTLLAALQQQQQPLSPAVGAAAAGTEDDSDPPSPVLG